MIYDIVSENKSTISKKDFLDVFSTLFEQMIDNYKDRNLSE